MAHGLTGTQQSPLISGQIADYARIVMDDTLNTAEIISGGRFAGLQSGRLIVAMAGQSGRMPAIGFVENNYLSGDPARVVLYGKVFSTQINISGGFPDVYLGLSGLPSATTMESSGVVIGSGVYFIDQSVGSRISNSGFFVDMHQRIMGIEQGEMNIPLSIPIPFFASEAGPMGCAVNFGSGNLARVAMASVSGRMPAAAVAPNGLTSGMGVVCALQGVCPGTLQSGAQLGKVVYVGRSGEISVLSGGSLSGGFLSGDIIQPIGTVMTSGKFLYEVAFITFSGIPSVAML